MHKHLRNIITAVLAVTLSLCMLSGCGQQETIDAEALVQSAVKAAMDATDEPVCVTIIADDKYITIEDAAGLSLTQLLERAKVTLNDGDILSFDAAQVIGSTLRVKVLRACHVTVTVPTQDPLQSVSYQTTIAGGTVADAIASVGVTLEENQIANYDLTDALVDNMQIIISHRSVAATPLEETKPVENKSEDTLSDASDTESSGRHEISRDVYYDCDDSGHGVIVITYSDGTQEEVYF